MQLTRLPYGAAQILELRKNGKRPADMVLVSLIGQLCENNPVVIASSVHGYDWRFLAGLSAAVVAATRTPCLTAIVKDIDAVAPETLSIWFADHQNGVNVRIDGYRPTTKTGRQMGICQRANLAGLGSTVGRDKCLRQIVDQTKQRAIANTNQFDDVMVTMATAGFRHIFGATWGAP